MGDRLATIDMGPKVGASVPLSVGELGLYLTQCPRADAYLSTKCHLDLFNRLATIHQRYRQTDNVPIA